MNKIVFSIPVHEKPEVIFDQICNIKYFNPGCAVVLHISPVFSWDKSKIKRPQFEEIIKNIPDVYINPEQVRTAWFDIIQAHLSNYKFIRSKIDFEYFILTASNELYIKKGAYDFISKYEASVLFSNIDVTKTHLFIYRAAADEALKNIIRDITHYDSDKKIISCIDRHQIEGAAFSVKVFDEIFALIEKYFDYKKVKYLYPREEIYFGTILKLIVPEEKICFESLTYFSLDTSKVIEQCKKERKFFSVKRVDREINNPLRAYIRDVLGGYHEEVEKLGNLEIKPFNEKDLEKFELQENKNYFKQNLIQSIKFAIRRIKPIRLFIDRKKFIVQ